jgi:hypothetical protein
MSERMDRLPIEGELGSFKGATSWLNSSPLTVEELRGKVVAVDFCTYSCINRHPIAVDSDYGVWGAFDNHYWPALYLADVDGRIRYHKFRTFEIEFLEPGAKACVFTFG